MLMQKGIGGLQKGIAPEQKDSSPGKHSPVEPVAEAASPENKSSAETSGSRTPIRRMVIRMIAQPAEPAQKTLTFSGTAMVLGSNRDAEQLITTLQSYGVSAVPAASNPDEKQLIAELDRIWEMQGPVSHLFLMTGRDRESLEIFEEETWAVRRRAGLFAPFYLLRHWLRKTYEAKMMNQCAVIAATNMNGDYGISSGTTSLECSGISGLLKTIHLEHGGPSRDGLTVRIVDAPVEEFRESLVAGILSELTASGFDIETAYINGCRYVPRLVNRDVVSSPADHTGIRPGSTWIITGGARGITAETAKCLGERYGLKLHLIGTSPLPVIDNSLRGLSDEELRAYKREIVKKSLAAGQLPEKEWRRFRNALEIDRNLRRMRDAKIDVTYHQCDITDKKQIADVFSQIRLQHGDIYGIVHGAGIDGNPAAIKNMTDAQFAVDDKLIAIKVDAVFEMLKHVNHDALRYFIGFGSISGRFGSANAASYCSANDMLCKMMGQLRKDIPQCRAAGIHWHAWGDVGMMMRPASYGSVKVLKMQLMPPEDGLGHLIRELEAGLPENEIVVTDSQYYSLFYSEKMLAGDSAATITAAASVQPLPYKLFKTDTAEPVPPLIDSICIQTELQTATGRCTFYPDKDPFLQDHRFRGRPFFPAVISLELFAETVRRMFPDKKIVAVHDMELIKGLSFEKDSPFEAEIEAETAYNHVACRLVAPLYSKSGHLLDPVRVFAKAVVETGENLPVLARRMSRPPEEQWHKIRYSGRNAMMYHGPVFQQVREGLFSGTHGVWGRIHAFPLSDFAGKRPKSGWQFHPAAIDACLYLCGVCVWLEQKGALGLPESFRCLRHGRLPEPSEQCMAHITLKSAQESGYVFDILCCGDNGDVLFSIDSYHCRIVPSSLTVKNTNTGTVTKNPFGNHNPD
jgi:NAD(P)-dependent dehydrogenase (short-subunit alcohol dehydrogenase family)